MSFYLHDNPNPNGKFYYDSRRTCQHGYARPHLIVLHSAENLPDFDPPDMGAESVARYASETQRKVSWHTTIDSDSTIHMLPYKATAWHVRGYNRCSVGIEIATQHDKWLHAPLPWLHDVYDNVADELARISAATDIPMVDVRGDASKKGVTTHSVLDPSRRKDPGKAFPFDWVVTMADIGFRYSSEEPPTTPDPAPSEAEEVLRQISGIIDEYFDE